MGSNSASSHSFQKLKIDTSAGPRPAPSSFASLAREDSSHSSQNGLTQAQSQSSTECIPTEAQTANGAYARRDHRGFDIQKVPYDVAVGSSASSEEDFDIAQFGRRATSISFDKEVRFDTGDTLALEVPVPKSLSRRTHTPESGSYSDQEYLEMPYSERRPLQHRVGVPRYPLLQTTVDSLAKDPEYNEQVASLTSETTASPPLEEARTPLETPTEYMLSPVAANSPKELPSFFSQRNGATRTRSYRSEIGEDGSLRRTSRRSSTRSGRSLSSMSPAASFLARYKPSEAPLKQSEPDDEGQGIGYNSEYIIGKQIGYGGISVVKEVTSMEDGKLVVDAVKILRKQLQQKSEFENEQFQTQFDHEVEIWRYLQHPYILPLLRVYTTNFATFCITKLNKGGTMFDLVRETRRQKKLGLPKQLVKRYAYQLASALRYLHNDVRVVHRDVKLENCLVDMTVPNAERDGGDVLLCDFGIAEFIASDQRDGPEPHSIGDNQNIGPADTSTSVAGSLQYAAPELFDAKGPVFSPAADIWAFGVILYALLTASFPFNESLDIKTTEKIREGSWDEEAVRNAEAVADGGIDDVLALLRGCLEVDVEKRWSIQDIMQCPWLRECGQQYENVSRSWITERVKRRKLDTMTYDRSRFSSVDSGSRASIRSRSSVEQENVFTDTIQETIANEAAGEDEPARQVGPAEDVESARKDALTKKIKSVQEAHAAKEFHSIEDVERAKTIDAINEASQYHTQESQSGMLPESKFTYQDVITSFFHQSTEICLGQSNLPLLIDWLVDRLLVRRQEPPIPRNRVRARWQCTCGSRLYDDFVELKPGAVRALEKYLSVSHQQSTGSSTRGAGLSARKLWSHTMDFVQSWSGANPATGNVLPVQQPSHTSQTTARPNPSPAQPQPTPARPHLYLLLCVDEGSGRPLYQEELQNVATDLELFKFLRSKYFDGRRVKGWFTLRSVATLSLSRFQLDLSGFAEVFKHDSGCKPKSCDCLPPVTRIHVEYHCRPAPEEQPELEPAIGVRRLTHYFRHPECINVTQKTILDQLPKRIGPLRASYEQEQTGWGMHIEESWHIQSLYFLIVVLVICSLTFGVVWSAKRGDIQGAFAISSFGLTLGSLLLGYLVVRCT